MQGMPLRFFTGVGETKELIIVDDMPNFFRHEHNLEDPRSKRWDIFVPCIDEHANCPVCAAHSSRPPYFAMYLTVIDLTPFVNSRDEEVEFSKKLLVVKPMQQKKIIRYYERHNTLRGMVLTMTRDNKKDAAIGDPEFVEFMEEADLEQYVSYYVDKDDVEHEIICSEPYNYEELFPPMSEDQLATMVGGGGRSNGARSNDDRALGRGRGREEPEGDAWAGAAPRRVASRRGAAAEPAEDVEYQDEAAPARRAAPAARNAAPARQAAAPARAARQAPAEAPQRAAPARRPARGETIDPDDLPDAGADDGPPFDTAPQRVSRPVRRPAPEPQEAAPAPRGDVAARRAALRR